MFMTCGQMLSTGCNDARFHCRIGAGICWPSLRHTEGAMQLDPEWVSVLMIQAGPSKTLGHQQIEARMTMYRIYVPFCQNFMQSMQLKKYVECKNLAEHCWTVLKIFEEYAHSWCLMRPVRDPRPDRLNAGSDSLLVALSRMWTPPDLCQSLGGNWDVCRYICCCQLWSCVLICYFDIVPLLNIVVPLISILFCTHLRGESDWRGRMTAAQVCIRQHPLPSTRARGFLSGKNWAHHHDITCLAFWQRTRGGCKRYKINVVKFLDVPWRSQLQVLQKHLRCLL